MLITVYNKITKYNSDENGPNQKQNRSFSFLSIFKSITINTNQSQKIPKIPDHDSALLYLYSLSMYAMEIRFILMRSYQENGMNDFRIIDEDREILRSFIIFINYLYSYFIYIYISIVNLPMFTIYD